jgi:hypothetical protein
VRAKKAPIPDFLNGALNNENQLNQILKFDAMRDFKPTMEQLNKIANFKQFQLIS